MREKNAEVATTAMLALLELGPTTVDTFDFLESRLAAWRDDAGSAPAIAKIEEALAKPERAWPGTAVVPPLAKLLENGTTGRGAATVLAMLGEDGAVAGPALIDVLAASDHVEPWRAMCALMRTGGVNIERVTDNLRHSDPRVRIWAAWALRESNSPTLPPSTVLPWLEDPRLLVRRSAIQALPRLREIPKTTLLVLVKALHDGHLRRNAHDTLTALGPRAKDAVPALVLFLESKKEYLRDRDAVHGTLAAILQVKKPVIPALIWVLRAKHPERSMGELLLATSPEDVIPLFMDRLEPDASGREHWDAWPCAHALISLGEAAAPVLPRLARLLDSKSNDVRRRALAVIASCGPAVKPLLPRVLKLLEIEDYNQWYMVLDVVRRFPTASKVTISALERAFNKARNEHCREVVIHNLHELGAAAEPLLLHAAEHPSYLIQSQARAELASLEQLSQEAAEKLAALLCQKEDWPDKPGPWRSIVPALEKRKRIPTTLRKLLPQLLDTADLYALAFVASTMVRDICPEVADHWAFEDLVHHSVDRKEVRRLVTQRAALVTSIRELAKVPHSRAGAAELLGVDQLGAGPGVPTLVSLSRDASPIVRSSACMSLGALGRSARAALPALAKAFRDTDPGVRHAATAALRSVHLGSKR